MVRAVVFDLDNTLYDYDDCDKYALGKLKSYCMDVYSVSAYEFEVLYGSAKKIVKERLGAVGASHNRMLYAQKLMELLEEKPASRALELYDVYWDAMLEHMDVYGYVLPLFRKLSQKKIKVAILTDLTAHIQHRKIRRLGIADYVDVLVTSEEAGKEKPSRQMFGLVMEKLKLAPEEILMIGDSYEKDIQGAKAVGMHGILYAREKAGSIIQECMELIGHEADR